MCWRWESSRFWQTRSKSARARTAPGMSEVRREGGMAVKTAWSTGSSIAARGCVFVRKNGRRSGRFGEGDGTVALVAGSLCGSLYCGWCLCGGG